MIKRKKYKPIYKNFIVIIIFIISLIGLTYSIIKIIIWNINNTKRDDEINKINDIVEIIEDDNTNNLEIVNEEDVKKNDPYWTYIKMNLIDVNFDELKSINNDVKGWIQLNGTNINYPFVQSKDNSYYLTHSFNKSYNQGGWVFMDYRNNINELNTNTILYAHGLVNKAMFGTLRTIFSSSWYQDANNHIIKLSTEKENTLWQVFSVYRIKNTSDYLKISFNDKEEINEFYTMLKSRSKYKFNTTINENDKIITLSTCYNDDEKIVMHAKLIKLSSKE